MRLFTGIALPPLVRGHLARVLKELRPLAPLNWSPVENLHITSKFIGQWPEEKLAELERALENMNFGRAFDVAIAGFGYFPNPHHPRAFFAGVQTGPALAELAHAIDEALRPLGIAKEDRPYAPHVTLARIKNEDIRALREHIAKMTDFDFGTFHVSEVHLYLSSRMPAPEIPKRNRDRQGAAVYTALASYPLLAAVKA
jgi:RNA 2',3'-cyclic 3'-phosphodiesterase